MNTEINSYISGLKSALDSIDNAILEKITNLLFATYKNNKTIFIMGNGGSAATASHFMVDLSKQTIVSGKKRIKAIALSDNIPSMTAWANDQSYNDIFKEQLHSLLSPGDILIAISASGNSENVLRAVQYAKENKATTIGLTGFDGGKLKNMTDETIIVESDNIGQVEDIHLVLDHLIAGLLKELIMKD